ncbi:hypothetical protein HDU67_005703, partial [Dinochytrium kinnereticum]
MEPLRRHGAVTHVTKVSKPIVPGTHEFPDPVNMGFDENMRTYYAYRIYDIRELAYPIPERRERKLDPPSLEDLYGVKCTRRFARVPESMVRDCNPDTLRSLRPSPVVRSHIIEDSKFGIASWNVNGLYTLAMRFYGQKLEGDDANPAECLMRYFEQKGYQIVCLQETRISHKRQLFYEQLIRLQNWTVHIDDARTGYAGVITLVRRELPLIETEAMRGINLREESAADELSLENE